MRKVIISILLAFGLFFLASGHVRAGGVCVEWGNPVCADRNEITKVCYAWTTKCKNFLNPTTCAAGYYACNKGCCKTSGNIGGGGPCKVCGGPGDCDNTGSSGCSSSENECSGDADCGGGGGAPSCTPSCSAPLCGQADGCGGTCAATDDGAPAAPTLTPANGGSVTINEGQQATVSWSAVTKAESYDYQLYPAGTSCSNAAALCGNKTSLTLSFTPYSGSYFYQVRAVNSSCGIDLGAWGSATFSVFGNVSGQVFDDLNREATLIGGVCQLAGASGVKPGAGSQVVVDGSYAGNVAGNGNYSVTAPAGSGHVATLTVDPDQWIFTCPADGSYSTDSPKSGLNYFVTNIRNAWFQVIGGSLHANGGNVSSEIPSTCTGLCDPYLIRADADGTVGLASYTGSLDLGDQTAENIAESSDDWQAQTAYGGLQTGYDYFSRILNDDPIGLGIWSSGAQPPEGVYNAQGVTRTDGTDWNIGSGEQIVLLVDGDLVIDNNINVDQGGFLAIIVSGNIVIADDVTNVEGVYIADGDIATCESAVCGSGGVGEQFTGEGIFVGWTGIEFRRDFDSTDNNTNPAETFTYRPDLQVNAYRYLLNPKYTWQEVAP